MHAAGDAAALAWGLVHSMCQSALGCVLLADARQLPPPAAMRGPSQPPQQHNTTPPLPPPACSSLLAALPTVLPAQQLRG